MNGEYIASYSSPSNTDLVHWKYIKKYKGKNNKWVYIYNKVKNAFSRDKNPYDSDAQNYEEKKAEMMKSDEWAEVRKNPEYLMTNENGQQSYNYDKYLFDKKHPVYDALTDIGNGRKVTVHKQSLNSVVAGAKDHISLGKKFIENVLTGVVGIATAKIMNNQGSYEKKKTEIKKTASSTAKMVSDASNKYESINGNSSMKSLNGNSSMKSLNQAYDNLDPDTKKRVNEIMTSATIAYDEYKKMGG